MLQSGDRVFNAARRPGIRLLAEMHDQIAQGNVLGRFKCAFTSSMASMRRAFSGCSRFTAGAAERPISRRDRAARA